MKPWRKQFGIWVPNRSLRDERGFISPSIIGAVAGSRRRAAAAAPEWGGETTLFYDLDTESRGTTVITLSAGQSVPAGAFGLIAINTLLNVVNITGVEDSVNGAWSSLVSRTWNTTSKSTIWGRVCASALGSGDTITITCASAPVQYRWGCVGYATGCSAVDGGTPGSYDSGYGTDVSLLSGTTSDAETVIFGMIFSTDAQTYGSGSWTTVDTDTRAFGRSYYLQSVEASSGTKNPGGSWGVNTTWGGVWAAVKA